MAVKTYADRAKQIMNKYKKRLGDNFDKGDVLALEAMNRELSGLRDEQEAVRMEELPENPNVFQGGGVLGPERLSTSHLNLGLGKFSDPNKLRPTNNTFSGGKKSGGLFSSLSEGDQFKSRVPWLGMASGIVGNMLMNKKIDLPTYDYEEYTPGQITPNLVNFGREREQTMRERDIANSMLMGASRGVGSQAGLMENLQAGMTGTQRVAGDMFGQSLEREGTMNAQIMNEAQRANESMKLQAAEINQRNKMYATGLERENVMIDADRRDARTSGIMGAITGYGKDRMAADQYDQMLEIATPENYRIGVGKDSPLRKLLGISPTMKRFFTDTGDTTSNTEPKKEKGGQLSTIQLFGDEEYGKIMMRVNKRNKTKK